MIKLIPYIILIIKFCFFFLQVMNLLQCWASTQFLSLPWFWVTPESVTSLQTLSVQSRILCKCWRWTTVLSPSRLSASWTIWGWFIFYRSATFLVLIMILNYQSSGFLCRLFLPFSRIIGWLLNGQHILFLFTPKTVSVSHHKSFQVLVKEHCKSKRTEYLKTFVLIVVFWFCVWFVQNVPYLNKQNIFYLLTHAYLLGVSMFFSTILYTRLYALWQFNYYV